MYLRCISCGRIYSKDEVIYSCCCGGLLEVVIDIDKVEDVFDGRDITLWKYKSFIPVSKRISLGEGGTPIYKLYNRIYLKNEGANPTGSFKDRGMTVGVSKAIELGMKRVICASTGNTAASLAAYSARAGIKCYVLVPSGKIALGKLSQAIIHGANVVQIKGNFDEALDVVMKASRELEAYILNSINPFRLEGQKTTAYEIYDQLRFVPDAVIVPVGNGGNISAIWKGFKEMKEAGIINSLPRMIGIQAEGASPLVRMFKEGGEFRPFERPETVATAIRIGNPVNWMKAIRAVMESNGLLESVTDEEILAAQRELASKHGVFVEPASAAPLAGLKKLRERGAIKEDENVVLIATGHGLKDPDIVIQQLKPTILINASVDELKRVLRGFRNG